ncbi:TetR/AcrR family transcriptional regulator [Paraburkholderia sp. C35]|uniref:TetR/AcrR family transcriptional regulator n=1 Tax=Paraburkholderia sp. C35 TaxID=2126993 RepID=UPI000D68EE01|nr:TetR/AcrR family transcriptional regulator [Paraburkholderia sp. C35]
MVTKGKSSPPSHRESLLKEGMRMFYATGFNGTSVDDVLAAAGAPKGSFYHHFGSKDDFAFAVLEEYTKQQLKTVEKCANADHLSAYQKIESYFDTLINRIERSRCKMACLAGKFSSELAPNSDAVSSAVSASLETWRLAITELVAAGHQDGSIRKDMAPEQQGFLLQALMQGSLVMVLADRSTDNLITIRNMLPQLLSVPGVAKTRSTLN